MNKNAFEIKESEILKNATNALFSLENGKVTVTEREDSHIPPSQRGFSSSVSHLSAGVTQKKFNLQATLTAITPDLPIQSNIQHEIFSALHRGICIASVVVKKFEESEMYELKNKLKTSALSDSEKFKMTALHKTQSAIFVHILANYLVHTLSAYSEGTIKFEDSVKVNFSNPMNAMSTFLYTIDNALSGSVTNDQDAASLVLDYAEQVLDFIASHVSSLENVDSFTAGVTYEVRRDEFEITGFERADIAGNKELVMDFIKPKEVIGNAIAKHQAMRLCRMMLCYDFNEQKNPFVELGGHVFTFLGDGKPGTGKTTVIKMMCGLLKEYCDIAGYSFYYENFGPDQIDSFQGKSGRSAKRFINNVLNPKVIGFGTIDDIDQVAGKRGDKQSSSGQQEVTAVLMESLAGANTVIRGNCTIGMFSNYPEMIDDALRQRAIARFSIDGPQTEEDYTDIFALLIGKYHDIPVGDANLFETQDITKTVKSSYAGHSLPKEEDLLKVYHDTVAQVGELTNMKNIGIYMHNISKAMPGDIFSGRSVKNITDNIKVRAMDFDMPDEWFEDPALFLHKSYEEKLEMIKSLREEITTDMVIQEINRFADSEFRYIAKSSNAEVKKAYEFMLTQKKASKLFQMESEVV